MAAMKPRWFVRGDVDGFFGLFIDNLLQLMLIHVLCREHCRFPDELIAGRILPGAAVSILIGNIFYSWQARRLMRATGRDDVTALPYGINTPSLLAYVFFVMKPVYDSTQSVDLAWQAGLFACLLSGVMEVGGAFVGNWLRRHTPRAALLSALAGIAITFIAMLFVFQLFAAPAIAIVPMMIILIVYAGRVRLPLGLPGGLVAVVVGAAIAWGLLGIKAIFPELGWQIWQPPGATPTLGWHPPATAFSSAIALLADPDGWRFLGVIVPMGLFNVIGSLQNLESAEAAGDAYATRPSLLANGVGSIAAALLGSPFPTTIYIGHPGWKAMGARAGYSLVNGVVITGLCLTGGVQLILYVVPIEAMLPILLWIGIIITAQAFQAVPSRHALAVAIGLIPAIAAWSYEMLIMPVLRLSDKSLPQAIELLAPQGLFVHGAIALWQGFLVIAMLLSAIVAFVIDHQFLKAAAWAAAAAVLSMVGLIHAYEVADWGAQPRFGLWAAPPFALAYWLTAALLLALHFAGYGRPAPDDPS